VAVPPLAPVTYQVTAAQQLARLPKVEQWYRTLEEGTGMPPEEYLHSLHHFSLRTNTHPEELVHLPDPSRESLIARFHREEEALGRDSRKAIAAVRSWVGFAKK
jgi:hypothetical protein